MNFIKYGIALVCFELLFWYFIFLIVSLPSMPFVGLIAWATGEEKTQAKRTLLIPILIGAFIFGNLIPSLFYSVGIFAITNHFMLDATHPMVYAVIGGLLCLWTRAPSGETNLFGTLISVVSYILYMTILKTFGQNVSDMGFRIVNLVFAVLIPVFIIGLITAFIFWIISKTRSDQQKRFPEQSPPPLPRARNGHSEGES
jgi:hypothetical protein